MPQKASKRGGRLLVGLAVSSGMIFGASAFCIHGSATEAAAQTGTPQYQVTQTSSASGVREVDVVSTAEREQGMRLIADDLRAANTPKGGTLLVEYHDGANKNTGFALVYSDAQAVLSAGNSQRFGEVYSAADAQEIMQNEDGMKVVSYKDLAAQNSTLWGKIKSFIL